jgi:hypothetical protein
VIVKVVEDMEKTISVDYDEEVVICIKKSINSNCVVIEIIDKEVDIREKSSDNISHKCRNRDNIPRNSSKKVINIRASGCKAKDKVIACDEEEVIPGVWFVGVEVFFYIILKEITNTFKIIMCRILTIIIII